MCKWTSEVVISSGRGYYSSRYCRGQLQHVVLLPRSGIMSKIFSSLWDSFQEEFAGCSVALFDSAADGNPLEVLDTELIQHSAIFMDFCELQRCIQRRVIGTSGRDRTLRNTPSMEPT
jgi:hypothetical protein